MTMPDNPDVVTLGESGLELGYQVASGGLAVPYWGYWAYRLNCRFWGMAGISGKGFGPLDTEAAALSAARETHRAAGRPAAISSATASSVSSMATD